MSKVAAIKITMVFKCLIRTPRYSGFISETTKSNIPNTVLKYLNIKPNCPKIPEQRTEEGGGEGPGELRGY